MEQIASNHFSEQNYSCNEIPHANFSTTDCPLVAGRNLCNVTIALLEQLGTVLGINIPQAQFWLWLFICLFLVKLCTFHYTRIAGHLNLYRKQCEIIVCLSCIYHIS